MSCICGTKPIINKDNFITEFELEKDSVVTILYGNYGEGFYINVSGDEYFTDLFFPFCPFCGKRIRDKFEIHTGF